MSDQPLTRSKKDRILVGVCGGIAEYFKLDPSLVRIGVVLICLITAVVPVCLIYGVMWFIIPEAS